MMNTKSSRKLPNIMSSIVFNEIVTTCNSFVRNYKGP